MSNFLVQPGTTLETFQNISDWTIADGSALVDANGLELTTNANNDCLATKTISASFTNKGNIKLRVYIPDSTTLTNLAEIDIYFSSSTVFSSYFRYRLIHTVANPRLHEGFNDILINRSAWTNINSEDWGNTMVRMRVSAIANSSTPVTVGFNNLITGIYSRPKCIFNFDDGYASVYTTVYPYLRQYGFKGATFINSAKIGTSGYATLSQLQELYANGWDIGNHTANHLHLSQQTADTVSSEIDSTEQWLIANGFTRNSMHEHFVYPYGDYNSSVIAAVAARNYLTARCTVSNRTQVNGLDNQDLLIWQSITAGDPTTANANCDRVISDGGVIMWGFHSVVDTIVNPGWEIDTATFKAIVDHVATKTSQMDVMTTTEWYYGLFANRKLI